MKKILIIWFSLTHAFLTMLSGRMSLSTGEIFDCALKGMFGYHEIMQDVTLQMRDLQNNFWKFILVYRNLLKWLWEYAEMIGYSVYCENSWWKSKEWEIYYEQYIFSFSKISLTISIDWLAINIFYHNNLKSNN